MEPANKYVQIQIKCSKNGINFSDRKYIDYCDFQNKGDDTFSYITDDYFFTYEFQNKKKRQIIAIEQYVKGVLEIYVSGSIGIEELKTAYEIIVINKDNVYFQCEFIDYSYEDLFDTMFKKYTVDLMILKEYLVSSANKADIVYNNSVCDYASSDYCLANIIQPTCFELINYEDVPFSQINGDFTHLSQGIKFYTKLYAKVNQTDNLILNKDTLGNGDEIVNKIINFSTATAKFFLSQNQFNQLKRYIDICHYRDNDGTNQGNTLFDYFPNNNWYYKGIKPATFEYKEKKEIENLGLYEVDITVYYAKLNYSPQLNK